MVELWAVGIYVLFPKLASQLGCNRCIFEASIWSFLLILARCWLHCISYFYETCTKNKKKDVKPFLDYFSILNRRPSSVDTCAQKCVSLLKFGKAIIGFKKRTSHHLAEQRYGKGRIPYVTAPLRPDAVGMAIVILLAVEGVVFGPAPLLVVVFVTLIFSWIRGAGEQIQNRRLTGNEIWTGRIPRKLLWNRKKKT